MSFFFGSLIKKLRLVLNLCAVRSALFKIRLFSYSIVFLHCLLLPFNYMCAIRQPLPGQSAPTRFRCPATQTDVEPPDIPRCCPGWPGGNSMCTVAEAKGRLTFRGLLHLTSPMSAHSLTVALPSFDLTRVIWLVSVHGVDSCGPNNTWYWQQNNTPPPMDPTLFSVF